MKTLLRLFFFLVSTIVSVHSARAATIEFDLGPSTASNGKFVTRLNRETTYDVVVSGFISSKIGVEECDYDFHYVTCNGGNPFAHGGIAIGIGGPNDTSGGSFFQISGAPVPPYNPDHVYTFTFRTVSEQDRSFIGFPQASAVAGGVYSGEFHVKLVSEDRNVTGKISTRFIFTAAGLPASFPADLIELRMVGTGSGSAKGSSKALETGFQLPIKKSKIVFESDFVVKANSKLTFSARKGTVAKKSNGRTELFLRLDLLKSNDPSCKLKKGRTRAASLTLVDSVAEDSVSLLINGCEELDFALSGTGVTVAITVEGPTPSK